MEFGCYKITIIRSFGDPAMKLRTVLLVILCALAHAQSDKPAGSEMPPDAKAFQDASRITDPAEKIAAFERIEMQIAGVVKFVKIVAATVGVCAAVCEVVRAVAPYFHR